ncbi:MAG: tRNA dihydrouridine synthase DusB [Eubacteriales bacterium]|nr:tRNA dihydrouridine synthase DusB [Eubacteriales bacterium]MDD4390783.1 tRNA dihydrouridine synthase DusB [Eubacteriales bacterium]
MLFRIGNIELDNPFLLAPLAGVSDAPFRRICRQHGAAMVYSEMISAKGMYYNDKNTECLLYIYEEERPTALQIFGSEPQMIAYAANELKERKNSILDINMGCPVPKIVKNGEGSALMKSPDLVYRLVEAAVKNAGKPVTVKIRKGFDDNCISAVRVAKAAEAAGAAAVAVHGRTREQYYSGKADWDIIKAVKHAVSVPVIGNGDIFCGEDALSMLKETGCDFVMIARGAQGNPWIFRQAVALWKGEEKSAPPTLEEKKNIMIKHLEDELVLKGEYCAVREMRKHVGWYLKGVHGSAAFRGSINKITNADEFLEAIRSL